MHRHLLDDCLVFAFGVERIEKTAVTEMRYKFGRHAAGQINAATGQPMQGEVAGEGAVGGEPQFNGVAGQWIGVVQG